MTSEKEYQIGTAGIQWGSEERTAWLNTQRVKRSYKDEVVSIVSDNQHINAHFDLIQYGALSYSPNDYPLLVLKSKQWCEQRKTIMITGGVHGYETSGVHGAIRFASTVSVGNLAQYNFLIFPCISPWGYETINRWNPKAIDPNRSFYANSPSEEAAALMAYLDSLQVNIMAHIDLHETTDTDNSEFRPALAARDAVFQKEWQIPDGFYLVGDSTKPEVTFQKAIIDAVQRVTHIAPADEGGRLIGEPISQFGVINYEARKLGLCMGLTEAPYVTTTEVYPDSPLVDDENCINAQVAVIDGALKYLHALQG